MKRITMLLVLASVVAVVASAQPVRPDFSGKWVLDSAKSEMPLFLQRADMTVRHQDPKLVVSERQVNDRGTATGNYNYTTDGVASKGIDQGTTYETTGQWEGSVLVIRQKITGGINAETAEPWSLSADGTLLTIERSRKDAKGTTTHKLVYVKQ